MSEPLIVYYSSTSENTKRFIERLDFQARRIPIDSKQELFVDKPFVLAMPTYGGGEHKLKGAVPRQVGQFLNNKENRANCVGVIGNGNTSFGDCYGLGARLVADKLSIPLLYIFEVFGTDEDVQKVSEGLPRFWNTSVLNKFDTMPAPV